MTVTEHFLGKRDMFSLDQVKLTHCSSSISTFIFLFILLSVNSIPLSLHCFLIHLHPQISCLPNNNFAGFCPCFNFHSKNLLLHSLIHLPSLLYLFTHLLHLNLSSLPPGHSLIPGLVPLYTLSPFSTLSTEIILPPFPSSPSYIHPPPLPPSSS